MNFNQYNDADLFDIFSDWYKDINGFRPRGWTREDIISWMEYEGSPEAQAQRQAEQQEEEEMIKRAMERWEQQDNEWAEKQAEWEAQQAEMAASKVEQYYYDMEMALGV